jgi:hypothetical protein
LTVKGDTLTETRAPREKPFTPARLDISSSDEAVHFSDPYGRQARTFESNLIIGVAGLHSQRGGKSLAQLGQVMVHTQDQLTALAEFEVINA